MANPETPERRFVVATVKPYGIIVFSSPATYDKAKMLLPQKERMYSRHIFQIFELTPVPKEET